MAEGEGALMGKATAKIGIDLSQLMTAARQAAEAGKSISKALAEASREAQAERKQEIATAQQISTVLKAQQAQITAAVRAGATERIQAARAEASERQQAARTAANAAIEAERRATAQFKSELREREQAAKSSRSLTQNLGSFAGAAIGGLGGPLGALAGGIVGGNPAAAAGLAVSEGARFAVDASAISVAYDRQEVAAARLVGTQSKLNGLLRTYGEATGGAVDDAKALSDVTSLVTQHLADNSKELDTLLRGVRGASVALGKPQQFIIDRAQLEILNQTGFRLNEIGLTYGEVQKRVDALRAANSGLSQQQAYQTAVVQALNDKFGALSKSAEGQATGAERAAASWNNFTLAIGKVSSPIVNLVGSRLAQWLTEQTAQLKLLEMAATAAGRALRGLPIATPEGIGSRTGIGAFQREGGNGLVPGQQAAIQDWNSRRQEIDRTAGQQAVAETETYSRQRAQVISNYERAIAREAEDFARQRADKERDYQQRIADVHEDAARREAQEAAQLARSIAQARSDSNDRLQDLQEDLDRAIGQRQRDSADKRAELEDDLNKSIEDRRRDSADRLIELEQDYVRSRARAEAAYQLDHEQAISRNDGRALAELEARHKLETQEAADAHKEQVDDEKKALQKAIDQLNQSHRERLEDEAKALDKSVKQLKESYDLQVSQEKEALDKRVGQLQESYNLQLAQGQAADAQRLTDMKTAFEQEQTQANTERTTRLTRQAEDAQAQLTAMDNEHQDRLTQISQHAADERKRNDDEFTKQLDQLGVHNAAYVAAQAEGQKTALESFKAFWKSLNDTILGKAGDPNDPLGVYKGTLQAKIDAYKSQQAAATDPAEKQRLQGLINQLQAALDAINNATDPIVGPMPQTSAVVSAARTSSATVIGSGMVSGLASVAAIRNYPMPALSPAAMGRGAGGLTGPLIDTLNIDINGVRTDNPVEFKEKVEVVIFEAIKRATSAYQT